jgi:hypothetical protein
MNARTIERRLGALEQVLMPVRPIRLARLCSSVSWRFALNGGPAPAVRDVAMV